MYEERPWLKNYTTGVPANIDPHRSENIVEFLDKTTSSYSASEAFACMGKSYTYGEIDTMSTQFGGYLQLRGMQAGEKFAIMMPSILQYPVAIFGALKAGLVGVNINPLYTSHEMLHQINDSGATAILILENFADKLEEILPQTKIKLVITTSLGELLGGLKKTITNFYVRSIKRMVPKYEIVNEVKFSDALKQGAKHKLQEHAAKFDDVAFLQYTGGTTGVSKGAMLTHGNLLSNMEQISAVFKPTFGEGQAYVALSPLPLYHIFAFSVNLMALFSLGVKNVLVPNPRDFSSIIKEFKNNEISMMTGVNTLFNALLNDKKFRELDFSLKVTLGGGMAVQNPVAERWQEVTSSPLIQGYGLTETAPVATVNPIDGSGKLGSIGLPVPSTDLKIVDENDNEVPAQTNGEICVKGPQVMKGYYQRPSETDKVLKDGWLHTGDIGFMDTDGYFTIVDRKKDMILVSGFNVYPNEVEEVIAGNPKVAEVAAIGVPDEKSGEVVKVFVVKKDNSLTEKELKEYASQYLTGYKKPKFVEFRNDLPKSNVGKILRRELREE